MDLAHLAIDTVISLKVKRESTVAEFETVLIEHVGNCLVCQPIMHEGKMINFALPELSIDISVFDNEKGKLYSWRQVSVKAGYYKKKILCHLIYLDAPPVEVNRRNNYRQYVGIAGAAQAFHRPISKVVIRDVSNRGVSFLVDDKGFFDVGKTVKVTFSDCKGQFNFTLECEIVRERELENGKYEFGCAVINPPQSLSAYVAHKQLEERKRVLGLL